jgi:hypothetical protein
MVVNIFDKRVAKAIESALHQIRTRSLRDAPIYLQHVNAAEQTLMADLIDLVKDKKNMYQLGTVFGMPVLVDLGGEHRGDQDYKIRQTQQLFDELIREKYVAPLQRVRLAAVEEAQRYEQSPGDLGEFEPIVKVIDEIIGEVQPAWLSENKSSQSH